MSLELVVIIILALLLLQALFAGSEIALISCDKAYIRSLADNGSGKAKMVLDAFAEIEKFISTTLVGINLSLITSTVILTFYIHNNYGKGSEFYTVLILSPLIVIFGQVVPKAVFQKRRNSLVLWVIYPLWFVTKIFYPILIILNIFTARIVKLIGSTENTYITREELINVIEGDITKPVTDKKKRIIKRIFRFSETSADEIMIPLINVVATEENSNIEEILNLINETGHSRIPVYKDRIDNITGIIHSFYLLGASTGQKAKEFAKTPMYVPGSKRVDELMEEMKKGLGGMAIVVDEYGGAVGAVTLEDILEEVVGEIEDEYDKGTKLWRKISSNEFLINPKIEIEAINDDLGLALPEGEGDYETLSGFLFMEAGSIPNVGDLVKFRNLEFTIQKATTRSIEEVRLVKKSPNTLI